MPFLENIEIANPIEFLNFCSCYTEVYRNDILLSKATSFFYNSNDDIYLVSNWHVLSDKNPKADERGEFRFQNKKAAIPNRIKICTYGWGNVFGSGYLLDIPLLDDNETPLFKSKKLNDNEYIDIACLQLNKSSFALDGKQVSGMPVCVNTVFPETIKSNYNIHPTDDVYVIGYPFGQINDLPIWKRASIASASNKSFKVFIDTATKSGMSGSPVFYVAKENNLSFNGKKIPTERGYKAEFIGIYSGRIIENIEDENNDSYIKINDYDLSAAAQLGILWKKSAIDYIIG